MIPDHTLLSAAQRCAGEHVHRVAQRLTVYQLGCEALDQDDREPEERANILRAVCESEKWLRAFVARRNAIL